MAQFDHGATDLPDDESPSAVARNARVGMLLFVVYLAFYAGFVLTAAFAPALMAGRPWAGVNLAIWYGFGLLGGALVLALFYSWLCRARDAS